MNSHSFILAFILELNHFDLNHPLTGNGYQSWSGILSDLGEISLVGTMVLLLIGAWHHVNCDVPGCKKVAKHRYIDKDGKQHKLCHKDDVDDHPKTHWWSFRRGHSREEIHARIKGSRIIKVKNSTTEKI